MVVDADDVIIIGHLRRAAGRSIGVTECPVHVARDLTPEQVRGLRLMDNRSHEEAGWDFDLLGPELIDLQRLGFGLELTGFDEQELASAMMQKTDGLTDPDDCPPIPEAPVSKPGDFGCWAHIDCYAAVAWTLRMSLARSTAASRRC